MMRSKAFCIDDKLAVKLTSFAQEYRRSEASVIEEALKDYFYVYHDVLITPEGFSGSKKKTNSNKELRKCLGE